MKPAARDERDFGIIVNVTPRRPPGCNTDKIQQEQKIQWSTNILPSTNVSILKKGTNYIDCFETRAIYCTVCERQSRLFPSSPLKQMACRGSMRKLSCLKGSFNFHLSAMVERCTNRCSASGRWMEEGNLVETADSHGLVIFHPLMLPIEDRSCSVCHQPPATSLCRLLHCTAA